MGSVLVLDGNERSSLAVVRSLGKKGISVTVGDYIYPNISSASRFCKKSIKYYNPYENQERFFSDIKAELEKNHYDLILPMTDVTIPIILINKEALPIACKIPFVPYGTYEFASDKFRMIQYAKEQSLPVPNTIFLNSKNDLEKNDNQLNYPVVIKPSRSRLSIDGKFISTGVSYAKNYEDLKTTISRNEIFNHTPFMIQEKIQGEGIGFFALYQNGVPKLLFSHRRLREKPPSGGVSVLCESIPVEATIKDYGLKILSGLKWHGVAMVEFKKSIADGIPYFMEINARFWGSLQLSIDSGVDFPYALYCITVGKGYDNTSNTYKVGNRCKWILGNWDYFYMLLKEKKYKDFTRSLFQGFSLKMGHFVFRLKDPKPFFVELKQYLVNLYNHEF